LKFYILLGVTLSLLISALIDKCINVFLLEEHYIEEAVAEQLSGVSLSENYTASAPGLRSLDKKLRLLPIKVAS